MMREVYQRDKRSFQIKTMEEGVRVSESESDLNLSLSVERKQTYQSHQMKVDHIPYY